MVSFLVTPTGTDAQSISDTAGIKGKTVLVKSSAGGCLTVKGSDPYSYAQVWTDDCDAIDKSSDLRGQQWIVEQETDSVQRGGWQLPVEERDE